MMCDRIKVDILVKARGLIGKSKYQRRARINDAPSIVSCQTLIQWLYAERGSKLQGDLFSWLDLGEEIRLPDIKRGDLVFTTGYKNEIVNGTRVGHVAIATGVGTIIHATNLVGVEELSVEEFLACRELSTIRRIIPDDLS